MNPPSTAPDALLLIGTECPHCAAVMTSLQTLVKDGRVGRVEIVNIERHPEIAAAQAVRSVPWLRLGPFELPGLRTTDELAQWAARSGTRQGMADYFSELFETGAIARAIDLIKHDPRQAEALVDLLGDPEAALQVRLGAAAVLEEFENSDELRRLTPSLARLTDHADARIRADACHILALGRDPEARAILQTRRDDPDATVREIAEEGLSRLTT